MSKQNTGDKYILIGATSGLGFEFFSQLPLDQKVLVVGRMTYEQFSKKLKNSQLKESSLENSYFEESNLQNFNLEKKRISFNENNYFKTDLSKIDQVEVLLEKIKEFVDFSSSSSTLAGQQNIIRIFYFAGGGPYGEFSEKKFSDHLWAMNVSYISFSRILHFVLKTWKDQSNIQVIAIGSAVAEFKPDYHAASYSAAKQALRGLIQSIQLEDISVDLRLFSPSYMQTKMLPSNSWVYQLKEWVWEAKEVASILSEWSNDPLERGKNKILAQDHKSQKT